MTQSTPPRLEQLPDPYQQSIRSLWIRLLLHQSQRKFTQIHNLLDNGMRVRYDAMLDPMAFQEQAMQLLDEPLPDSNEDGWNALHSSMIKLQSPIRYKTDITFHARNTLEGRGAPPMFGAALFEDGADLYPISSVHAVDSLLAWVKIGPKATFLRYERPSIRMQEIDPQDLAEWLVRHLDVGVQRQVLAWTKALDREDKDHLTFKQQSLIHELKKTATYVEKRVIELKKSYIPDWKEEESNTHA